MLPIAARSLGAIVVLVLASACGGGEVFVVNEAGVPPDQDASIGFDDQSKPGICGGCTSDDCDGDGLKNANETTLGTDPCKQDSDGDGITDSVEVNAPKICVASPETDTPRPLKGCKSDTDCPKGKCVGYDPTNKDQDGDGVVDGEEDRDHDGFIGKCRADCPKGDECGAGQTCQAGICTPALDAKCIGTETDPRLKDTDGNGTTDDKEGGNVVCNTAALINPTLNSNGTGDWTLALDPKITAVRAVTIKNGKPEEAAVTFDDASATVAGFVLSKTGATDPLAQDQADEQKMGSLPLLKITGVFNRQPFKTYDGFSAVVSQRIITATTATDAAALRDKILVGISGHTASDFTVNPGTSHGAASKFTLLITTVVRKDRVVVTGAVAPQQTFDNKNLDAQIRMRDLTNGTALAQKGFGLKSECDGFVVDALPVADFVWLVDTSGSMRDDQTLIANSATEFFKKLTASGIDFRVGVMRGGCTTSGVNLTGGAYTKSQATFSSWMRSPSGPSGCEAETPVTAGKNLFERKLAVSPKVTKPGDMSPGLRTGAKLIYVFVTDEEERNFQSSDVESRTKTQAQMEAHKSFAPLLAFYKKQQIISFGMIAIAPACTNLAEPSWIAKAMVEKTGGASWPICKTDKAVLNAALQAMITAAQGASSTFKLTRVPISSTLKLALGGNVVPRSAANGFDYDGPNNAIIFNLAANHPNYPKIGDKVVVSYRFFENAPAIN